MTRAYEIEVGFYGEVSGRIRTRMPRCYHRQCDPASGWFVLLLEDLVDAAQGEQLDGCGVEVAAAALGELAALHGPAWGQVDLAGLEWLDRGGPEADEFLAGLVSSLWPGFVERYGDRLDAEHLALGDRFIGVLGPWLAERPPATTVTHGDYRLDNLLFRPGDVRPYVVDWQTASWGSAASDVAYFLGGSLTAEDRRAHGTALLDGYHRALVAEGVVGFDRSRLDEEYRQLCFGGLVMSIGASMLVKRTERGDEMFVTSVARYAQQALDLGAEDTLPTRRKR
jgi:aminoglycoside/choline kinase family phosphotransferase